jgi:signal transduction histidine kinase
VLCIVTALDQANLQSDQPQPVVRIEFADTGVGMPPEVLSQLFEPLFTTKEQGTGFGLFTSYKIIEAHQGRISVTSKVGQGTTFTILLPVEKQM